MNTIQSLTGLAGGAMSAVLAPGAGCALRAAEACAAGAAVRTGLAPGAVRALCALRALPAASAIAASGAVTAPDASDAVGASSAPATAGAPGAVAAVHAASAADAVCAAATPDAIGASNAARRLERGPSGLLDGDVGDAPTVAGSVDVVIAVRADDLRGDDCFAFHAVHLSSPMDSAMRRRQNAPAWRGSAGVGRRLGHGPRVWPCPRARDAYRNL